MAPKRVLTPLEPSRPANFGQALDFTPRLALQNAPKGQKMPKMTQNGSKRGSRRHLGPREGQILNGRCEKHTFPTTPCQGAGQGARGPAPRPRPRGARAGRGPGASPPPRPGPGAPGPVRGRGINPQNARKNQDQKPRAYRAAERVSG